MGFEKAGTTLHGDVLRNVVDHLRGGRRGCVGLVHRRQVIGLHAERRKPADLLSHADLPRLVAWYVLSSPVEPIVSLQKIDAPTLSERISALESEILAAMLRVSTTVADSSSRRICLPKEEATTTLPCSTGTQTGS
jgi:hypothetical protein